MLTIVGETRPSEEIRDPQAMKGHHLHSPTIPLPAQKVGQNPRSGFGSQRASSARLQDTRPVHEVKKNVISVQQQQPEPEWKPP